MKKNILKAIVAITFTIAIMLSFNNEAKSCMHPDCLNGCLEGNSGCVCYSYYAHADEAN